MLERFSIYLVLCGLAAACTSKPSSVGDTGILTSNGFEQSVGWGGSNASITNEKAHEGIWSIRVKPDVPFSYTYARVLGELKSPIPHKLELSAWVLRLAAGSTAQLVVQVDASATDEQKVFYQALALEKAVSEFGNWKEVKMVVTLPASVKEGNRIKVYLWNNKGTSPTYADDIVLRATE